MSHREVVRKPLQVREGSRRTFDQWLAVRVPGLSKPLSRLGGRLPLGSRVRQILVWRASRLGYEAFNRGDLEAALINYHPELRLYPPRGLIDSGVVEAAYRGHDGYRQCDRLLTLGQLEGRGESSGARVKQEYASLTTMSEGQVVRQDEYFDHAEALEAVGLSE